MSETDSDWFLRHRDGVEHGPFRLADIVAAARAGNVADDTSVRHAAHTKGQWVFAPRIGPIAQALTAGKQGTPQSAPAPAGGKTSEAKAVLAPASRSPTPQPQPPSVFQRAPTRAVSPTPRPAEAAARSDEPVAATAAESAPAIRSLREHSFPVPRTFLDAVVALFDFRFRHFITPWIIKILWALAVVGAILWLGWIGLAMFIEPSIASDTSIVPSTSDGWQFEPLEGTSLLRSRIFAFGTLTFSVLVFLLCTRLMLELGIVLFYIAKDLRELNREIKQRE